jgi:large subunit ribosomal protein L23e
MPAVIIRQRKAWRRRDGVFIYFEGMFSFATQKTSRSAGC